MISRIKRAFRAAAKNLIGVAILGLVMSLGGCIFWPVNEKEVIGTYQAVLQDGTPGLPDGGSEILELNADGTCTQKITLKNGRSFLAQGTWKYNKSLGNITLEGLHNAVKDDVINPDIEKTTGFLQSPSVCRNFIGQIILGSTETPHYEKK